VTWRTQDGAVEVAFAKRKIIDPQHVGRRQDWLHTGAQYTHAGHAARWQA